MTALIYRNGNPDPIRVVGATHVRRHSFNDWEVWSGKPDAASARLVAVTPAVHLDAILIVEDDVADAMTAAPPPWPVRLGGGAMGPADPTVVTINTGDGARPFNAADMPIIPLTDAGDDGWADAPNRLARVEWATQLSPVDGD